jgi:tetratricopeptide (TPR) repeat protein
MTLNCTHRLWTLWLPAALLLAACAGPVPPYSNTPSVQRPLDMGTRFHQLGQLHEARTAFDTAVSASERFDDRPSLVDALMARGAVELALGLTTEARASYVRALEESRQTGLEGRALRAGMGLAETERLSGAPDLARQRLESLRGWARHEDEQRRIDQGLALCLIGLGQPQAAARLLAPWLQRLATLAINEQASLLASAARLQLALGDPARARSEALRSLELDRAAGHPPSIAADHLLLAEIATAAGDAATAQLHRERARRMQELMGISHHTQETRR